MTGLRLDRLRVMRGEAALVDLDLTVAPGEVLSIMGPSGSGKSTALAAIIGTLDPVFRMGGRILLDGRDVTTLPTHARRIGLLMQEDVLFPHLSVGGNLGFALPPGLPRPERRARIDEALEQAGLGGSAARDPATLSGGQRARVALLRTLLAEPGALLLDEPFSSLDAELRAQIRQFVLDRARERGLPVVLVTHEPEDARAAGGPVVSPLGTRLAPWGLPR
ncbi:ATP-binding cassette domain-containing protein [Cereibacter sphaeroides]|uniref:ATP-binding cassette domain-containing protein n=1 Tax=Cereibacter sphaeroides TaxID=1063 RepID=UPI001F1A4098|nr:ATP-binding cassette domain-containing protein [Cereibacter sphaeroides]MCE6962255.1 ATP-binding cassette domain-containing protein [Cereibacter sphaeroides]MCE6971031.1 ATP-binding cassette domain-containing protein [Cereibacter sphaeroides]MCE6971679.1 ATP-binding cassette domain-containing protein [Cereibacter sphaeroides]